MMQCEEQLITRGDKQELERNIKDLSDKLESANTKNVPPGFIDAWVKELRRLRRLRK